MLTCEVDRAEAPPAIARRSQAPARPGQTLLFGSTPAMQELRELIASVRDTDVPVLIQGETGTGKELVARALMGQGRRDHGPFVKVNCAAVPVDLFESELFGCEPGAFTGADHGRAGKFEAASGGVIFLDEVGELPLSLQAKLLHVVQDGHFARIGAAQPSRSTARIVAATNRDLDRDVQAGGFRADLLFRLNVIPVRVPPLRERQADIPQLLTFFADRWAARHDRPRFVFSTGFMDQCLRYRWPGNIRELENVVQRAVLLGCEEPLPITMDAGCGAVPAGPSEPAPPLLARVGTAPIVGPHSLRDVARDAASAAEGECIARMLHVTRGNRRKAASNLGVCYKSFLKKARQHGL